MLRNGFWVLLLALGVLAPPAWAAESRVLKVGPDRLLTRLGVAAALARDGDRIEIDPGTYVGCAVWRASSLAIVAMGEVTITGPVCENRGIFVIRGSNILIRGITFTRARSTNHNGAGIRVDGRDLAIEASRFVDNENGILAAPDADSSITIRDSYFAGNGKCDGPCAHGIYVNRIGELIVERSVFREQHVGHHIKSRALRTVLTDNVVEDGPAGTSSYLVDIPNGGTLIMRGNRFEKGPNTSNRSTGVIIGAEGASNPTPEILIENNVFANRMTAPTRFVRNLTNTRAVLRANTFTGTVRPLDGPGVSSPP